MSSLERGENGDVSREDILDRKVGARGRKESLSVGSWVKVE